MVVEKVRCLVRIGPCLLSSKQTASVLSSQQTASVLSSQQTASVREEQVDNEHKHEYWNKNNTDKQTVANTSEIILC
ncbi:hypothetical protein DPMN_074579 [Dreissena polymorpha]|uniref:Uncharacterized protein n=1 Tax=Dreissena polymorpha TaxID=45954 RepID=A0A9D3YFA8_DREPO|nr:hypothetical protein DPMN_074579 [Dreissena polymorpha]